MAKLEKARVERGCLRLRGVSEDIEFYWLALVVTLVSCMYAPRYKLHISKNIAEQQYQKKKL